MSDHLPRLPDDEEQDFHNAETQPYDHDVPFRLPMAEGARVEDDDETGDMPAVTVSASDRLAALPPRPDQRTLPGSSGLDPNPDFDTVPRRSEPTMRNPKVQAGPGEPQTQQRAPAQPGGAAQPGYNPYQRPPAVTPQGQQGALPPMPPGQPPAGYVPQAQPPYPQQPPYGQPQPYGGQPQAAPPHRRSPGGRRKFLGMPMGCLYIFLGTLLTFCGGFTLLSFGVSAWAYNRIDTLARERLAVLDTYTNFQSTFYYDRSGTLLYEVFGEGRRTNVPYSQFPQVLIDATIAIEDDSFWTNPGIQPEATVRAFLQYVGLMRGATGGSSITQQVVRNVLFDFDYRAERSVQRKVEEIILALALNGQRGKQDILALYLNEIYYGNLSYGAQAAAQTFFGKDVQDLTLGEAALLAGLPQSPAFLDPLNPDPDIQDAVQARWRQVLDRMLVLGYITQAQYDDTLAQGLSFQQGGDAPLNAPHFTVFARSRFETLMTDLGFSPEQIARGGWKVYTTLDLNINQMVQQVVSDQVARLAGNVVTNGAAVVIQPTTGQILAMVGSADYNNDAIDGRVNVVTAVRQPGSTMKIFTYAAALETGLLTPGSVLWDTPTLMRPEYPDGQPPRNYDGSFHGPMPIRTALANSYNIPALQTMRMVGVDYYLNFLQRLGISSLGNDTSQYGISLTLGGGEVSLLELSNGYAVFANMGNYVRATPILCVVELDGDIVYDYEGTCPEGRVTDATIQASGLGAPVLDPRIAYLMTDVLGDNAARTPAMGSNSVLNTGALYSSVKTGTTNDFKDNWTVGFTPNVVVGVWVGNADGTPMNGVSGLAGAAPIWNAVITTIHNTPPYLNQFAVNGQLNPAQWSPPSGMTLTRVCDVRRLSDPSPQCPAFANEWLLDGPAGIPDGQGGFQYGAVLPPPAQPSSGPYLVPEYPGMYRVTAQALPPQIAAMITFPGVQTPPPAPRYCQVPVELQGSAPAAQSLLFLAPPPNPDDAARAEAWARERGLAFLPTITCTPELLAGSIGGGPIASGTGVVITSPLPGQAIPSSGVPVFGTAQFDPNEVLYYKLEIQGGNFPNWTTIGDVNPNPVVNGQLGFLAGAPSLAPGSYTLRLTLISRATADVLMVYDVPFVINP